MKQHLPAISSSTFILFLVINRDVIDVTEIHSEILLLFVIRAGTRGMLLSKQEKEAVKMGLPVFTVCKCNLF